ncbi:beta-ketoacyl synthase N-terminal-like domain-containing protein [Massilia pseudoviolaceinigra]|uniref:beta-ketoacyl synthase N-terminal-like domain-containing protein n=1 Tax=Massilia pseudoviolaceinigra TaxID=3057165 RepID=UPI002796A568|nr:beta-ketoacyl synthase N-terminal-like domain-containing protein [Massilia sp. CCM 9206]MDQ1924666.1 beta-ketoacyl synthase N-terminal-like domain-containing protein [Massilia sp. CCM 9206]
MSAVIREDLDIAVIGLAGRFPGAENCQAFWRNLLTGVDSVSRFSEEELLAAGHDPDKIRNKNFVPVNGVLQGAEYFDAEFFGYSQAEAAVMDPQTRLMLECVWHALENAGVDPDRRGRNIGLFLGARSTVQWTMQAMLSEQVDNVGGFLASQLSNKDAMSTLISWKLGLQGPSFTMQTACSTSLVSIHQAVQSLLNGECEFAVAGGVSLLLPQQNGHTYQDGMLFSRDGKTRAFDAEASGSVFGSGLGAVVLRRAGDAIADGDSIWAILKSSAINNDGARKVGYTAPSVKGQADVIRSALGLAEVEAADLDVIECHGTATALGDSIEFMALHEVFNANGVADAVRPNRCALGAVKGNIGHLDAAAGVAGFIKMVMALRYGVIPPTLHFQRPNPQLEFERSPFYINTCAQPWTGRAGKPRQGGVSSFGIGGTNAHVVLQQYLPANEQAPAATSAAPALRLFPFSARNPAALTRLLETMAQWLVTQDVLDLQALAHTLARRRSLPCRLLLAADSRSALLQEIKRYLAQDEEGNALAFLRPALESSSPDKLEAVAGWLGGKQRDLPASALEEYVGPPLMDVPAYPFEREAHGASHISDKTWVQIANLLAAPEERNRSKNEAGLLLPFWRPVRVPAAATASAVRAVLLADSSLSTLADGLAGRQVETRSLDLRCPTALRSALSMLTADAQPDRPLVVALAFPAEAFLLADDSLHLLAELGKTLAMIDFSGFASTHLYLLAPQSRMTGEASSQAGAVFTVAALKALALVAPQEIPGIRCAFLGIDDAGSTMTQAALAGLLRAPLPGPLKLTEEGLFVEDFRSPDAAENEVLDADRFVGKTFVITGAGGRMAKAMALVLARRFQARLALVSRQPADSPAMQELRDTLLAAGAAAVEVFPFGLTSAADGVTLFAAIRERLGDIFAVIHAAGVTDGDSFSPLASLEAGHYQAQLRPKALAAQILAQVFDEVPVEYCFVTSSMSTFFGGIAHAPYAAANLFLDGWGQCRNRRPGGTRWVVVNWETVHFEERPQGDSHAWGANEVAFTGVAFPALFEKSLREYDGESQKIFSAGGFAGRLYAWGGRRAPACARSQTAAAIKLKSRPSAVGAAYREPSTPMQRELAAIWSAILGVDGIGVDDHYMELGGDSLKTIVMAEKIYKKLGKRIAIQEFFAQPTIREVERQCLQAEQAPSRSVLPDIDPAVPIVASSDQERLYIHQTTFRDASYNMPVAFQCPTRYSAAAIAAAIRQVADRHLVLKCLFEHQDAKLMMLPQPDAEIDLSVAFAASTQAENLAHLEQFAAMPFDLRTALPIRAMLLESAGAGQPHQVLIVVHHIVCDAVSLSILAHDFQRLLEGAQLPPLEYNFAAYRHRQQVSESAKQARKDKAYWLANLLPLPKPLELPITEGAASSIEAGSHRGVTVVRPVPAAMSEAIRRLCDSQGISPFIFFLGAFGALITKIGRTDAVLFGVPVTGRSQPEELSLVGYLVNMLAMKVEPDPDFPTADYLLDLQAQWEESMPYQRCALNDLLDTLRSDPYCQNRHGRHPLFDVVFGYLPFSLNGAAEAARDDGFSRLELAADTAKFDLLMEVSETSDSFDCLIQYRENLFSKAVIASTFDYFFILIEAVLADPDIELGHLLPSLNPQTTQAPPVMALEDVDKEFDF